MSNEQTAKMNQSIKDEGAAIRALLKELNLTPTFDKKHRYPMASASRFPAARRWVRK